MSDKERVTAVELEVIRKDCLSVGQGGMLSVEGLSRAANTIRALETELKEARELLDRVNRKMDPVITYGRIINDKTLEKMGNDISTEIESFLERTRHD
jgi:hypothetical protein